MALAFTLAKLAGLHKNIAGVVINKRANYYDPALVLDYFHRYAELSKNLSSECPELYGDLPSREIPESSGTSDNDGRGYIEKRHLMVLHNDLEYIFEVWSNSKVTSIDGTTEHPLRIFISHGSSEVWRAVQAYIEKDEGIDTLELAQQPNLGRTILQKLDEESSKCSYAVIVMTGDDQISENERRTRENVMHEIGFFQGKFGLSNVCLLYEEGTNIPSNIHGLAYIPFPKDSIESTFGALSRELRATKV